MENFSHPSGWLFLFTKAIHSCVIFKACDNTSDTEMVSRERPLVREAPLTEPPRNSFLITLQAFCEFQRSTRSFPSVMVKQPRIAIFDIETSPNISYTWETYETNVIEFVEEWKLLTFAFQWLGQKKVTVRGLDDFKGKTDEALVKELWALFDEADILIGHNINSFDIKKANARFLHWGLKAPSHFRTIDTMRVYKKHFKDNRNGLNYICEKHNLGKKVSHQGFDLWKGCLENDPKSWKKMKQYNAHDVRINTKLYEFLLPWIDNHPNLNMFSGEQGCTNCQSTNVMRNGFRFAQSTKYQKLQCKDCGNNMKQAIKKDGTGGMISNK